jgi:hypothetical protein
VRLGPLFIGWQPIDRDGCVDLDLSLHDRWEGFYVEWGGSGFLLCARRAKAQP